MSDRVRLVRVEQAIRNSSKQLESLIKMADEHEESEQEQRFRFWFQTDMKMQPALERALGRS